MYFLTHLLLIQYLLSINFLKWKVNNSISIKDQDFDNTHKRKQKEIIKLREETHQIRTTLNLYEKSWFFEKLKKSEREYPN